MKLDFSKWSKSQMEKYIKGLEDTKHTQFNILSQLEKLIGYTEIESSTPILEADYHLDSAVDEIKYAINDTYREIFKAEEFYSKKFKQ